MSIALHCQSRRARIAKVSYGVRMPSYDVKEGTLKPTGSALLVVLCTLLERVGQVFFKKIVLRCVSGE